MYVPPVLIFKTDIYFLVLNYFLGPNHYNRTLELTFCDHNSLKKIVQKSPFFFCLARGSMLEFEFYFSYN